MELIDLVGASGGVAFVMAFTAFTKLVWPKLPGELLPIVALVSGVGLQVVLALNFNANLLEAVIWGFVSAFIASGVWSQGRNILGV